MATDIRILNDAGLTAIFDSWTSDERLTVYVAAMRKAGLIQSKQAKANFKSIYKGSGKHLSRARIRINRKGKAKLSVRTSADMFTKKIVVSQDKTMRLAVLVGSIKAGLGRLFHLFEEGSKVRYYTTKQGRRHKTGAMAASHFWKKSYDSTEGEMSDAIMKNIKIEFVKLAYKKGAI